VGQNYINSAPRDIIKLMGRIGQIAWNKGKKLHYQVWNKGKRGSDYAKAHGFGKWMTGKKQSEETRRKKSEAAKRAVAEGRHNFYIDGRTTGNRAIRTSLEYKLWRTAVFERDNYTCIWCGARSGNGKKVVLHADHIKPFAYYPELRFAIDNGRTLCIDCHKTTGTYAGKATKKK